MEDIRNLVLPLSLAVIIGLLGVEVFSVFIGAVAIIVILWDFAWWAIVPGVALIIWRVCEKDKTDVKIAAHENAAFWNAVDRRRINYLLLR